MSVFMFAATCAGFFTGISNVGAPPLLAALIHYNAPKAIARGVLPISFMVGIVFRVGFTTAIGGYNWAAWRAIVAMVLGGVTGVVVGDHIGALIDDRLFLLVLSWLLLFAAVALLGAPLWLDAVLAAGAITSVAIVNKLVRK
jgi:uncharacterized membrane protein YfcA